MVGRDGFVVIDKPPGITSHDVVARLRRVLGTRRVGHGGTLDPQATGVLIVAVGRATRLLRWVSAGDKCYRAVVRLGSTTTTDDADGEVLATASVEDVARVDDARLGAAIDTFRGTISQRPSSVSAIKVDGKRAHARVRDGEVLELPPREVTIADLRWELVRRDAHSIDLDVDVCCSSGTYVRALARDLGESLGVGGHLLSLRRTSVRGFTVDEARSLEDVTPDDVTPMAAAVERILPVHRLDASQVKAMRHGQPVPWPCDSEVTHAFLSGDDEVVAIGSADSGNVRYDCVLA